jgi:hypothetical protein
MRKEDGRPAAVDLVVKLYAVNRRKGHRVAL